MTKSCNCFSKSNINWCLEWLCEETPPEQICDVGYFYDFGTGNISAGSPIDFKEEAITQGGITQDITDTTEINIANTGLYEVLYFIGTQNSTAELYGLELNGSTLSQTIYSGAETKARYGQAFIEVTTVPSILKLIAITGFNLNNTTTPASVNASLTIKKLCDLE